MKNTPRITSVKFYYLYSQQLLNYCDLCRQWNGYVDEKTAKKLRLIN